MKLMMVLDNSGIEVPPTERYQHAVDIMIKKEDMALPFDEFVERYVEPAFAQLKHQREYKQRKSA